MGDTERNARCLSCGESYPAATGVCPHCGAPPITAATDGTGYRVVVPEIPSLEQRAELAAALPRALDCVHDEAELNGLLGKGNVHVICGSLTHEAAQMLAGFLKKMHISPQVEPDGASGSTGRLSVGVVLLAAAIALPLLWPSFWGYLLAAGLGLAGILVLAMTLIGGAYRRGAPLCLPHGAAGGMPGWAAMPSVLAPLLLGLEGEARAALSQVAVHIAHIQDGILASSMAGIAAGGPGSGLDQAAQKLLAGAVSTARDLVDEKGDSTEMAARLATLASSAEEARRKFDALGSSAAAKIAGTSAPAATEDPTSLGDDLAAELEAAAKALDEI